MSEDDFLLFEFLDTFDSNEDDQFMSEENLAEKRAQSWRNFKLRDAVLEVDKVSEDLPEICQVIRSSKIETVRSEFEDLFDNVAATKTLLGPDIGLLKQYPNRYGESGANYWRSIESKLESQLETYLKEVKSTAISELKYQREQVSRDIAEKFEELREAKLQDDPQFQTYYWTYPLWQNAKNELGEVGISPSRGRENWQLIKLIRERNFNKPSVVVEYITPSSEDPTNFQSQRTTLEEWINEELLDQAQELYEVFKILSGNQLRNELRTFLFRR